ncbi:tRNA (adenosine(37)-N6)-dimethylallyltransferase MiaA [Marivita sp. GX14005]|uniref:tRNA (adenosine(37)-N6)-dimethylallyltransferase MiaA n=1 Tax=Marivita sp. GX14005 TaxID=2942276 RepID=UPI00201877BF|nr:tRNA (adenosine(37)-N6)-dimethylallyltransferase MiaA [Marivita sp. GX14005]MCL3880690.1 tRNA (adenosine(37)-N6)-dimethylallyltransferase MiaA [Marivita sp. GX14005]
MRDTSFRADRLDPARPVLIAGPTASGKSELALRIAEAQGGVILNADAIQVYEDWRVLTARPSRADEARAPHALYGHVPGHLPYSVGDWLRDLEPYLAGPERPIIVGGTGLYFTALTEGLAQIPQTPAHLREEAMARIARDGHESLIAALDPDTRGRIDLANPMRVQRAWEVHEATGRGLAEWQDATPPPLLPLGEAQAFVVDAPKDWLTPRIAARFARMIDGGALDEARANREGWHPALPSAKAIGAAELMAVLDGEMALDAAAERVTILTRQFAKRQRTWFRARMRDWQRVSASDLT